MGTENNLQKLIHLIRSGEITNSPKEDLEKYLSLLCTREAYSGLGDKEFPQISETVRLLLFKRYMETLAKEAEKSAKKTEKLTGRILFLTWVIATLTAALLFTVFFEFPKIAIKL